MSINIDDSAYSTLNTYAVLAYSGIITVDTTTITNGFYGSSPTASYTGTFVGTQDSINAGTAQTQLTALKGAINTFRSGLTSTTLGTITSSITLYPGINYNSGSTITFESISIILDGQGDSNSQFLSRQVHL